MINTKDMNKARNEIEELSKKGREVVVLAQDDVFNRKMLENPKVDILVSPERLQDRDKLKQRSSGLNEVMCRLAGKNKIKIGINIEVFQEKQGREKALLIEKLIQNIKLLKRTKTKFVIFPRNKYDKRDCAALFLSFGANTKQVQEV